MTDKRLRTFILIARFPGSSNPTRRAVGEYRTVTLEQARKTARAWLDLISAGIDPKEEVERKKRAELRKRADTFESAVDEYAKRVLPKQRRGKIVEHERRREFCERWGDRAITSIERRDVSDAIKEVVDRGALYQAHNLLAHLRAFFNWAISTEDYGLEYSPCDRIRPKLLIGERKPRQRVLTDAEIKAFAKSHTPSRTTSVGRISLSDHDANEVVPIILVVDDEFLIRALLSDHLQECGFKVLEAASADEAKRGFPLVLRTAEKAAIVPVLSGG